MARPVRPGVSRARPRRRRPRDDRDLGRATHFATAPARSIASRRSRTRRSSRSRRRTSTTSSGSTTATDGPSATARSPAGPRLHSIAFTTPKARPEHGYDTTTRCERPRPGCRGRPQDRMGRPADARSRGDSRALRAREAARGLPRLRLPARHDRDREPDAHPQGRRRRRRPVRLEPPLDAGRRRRRPRRRVRDRHVRDQGRGRRHLLLAPRGGDRPPAAHHDGRRRRRDRHPPLGSVASSSAT